MKIYLYNTLGKKKEQFKPVKPGLVKIYNCGPTVYDRQHIGNMRSVVVWDTLRRVLEFGGFKVKQIINITDFGHLTSDADEGEDKMAKGLRKEGLPFTLENMKRLGQKYAKLYIEDRKKINALSPAKLPYASDHIAEVIKFISKLEKKGYSYVTSDGVYFDTSKDKNYGKLGGISKEIKTRIGINSLKRNSEDFALWKFSKKDDVGWDSPWGKGSPGWHTECGAIILKHFTNFFSNLTSVNQRSISNQRQSALIDIHTGGIEHIPIHHNNEIAQTESATGIPLAHYWLHNEHLIMSSGPNSNGAERASKMAKSLGNIVTLKEIEEKGFDPFSLRYLFLGAHYRSPISFSWQALGNAEQSLKKLRNNFQALSGKKELPNKNHLEKFRKYINDDLDTPKALAFLWKIIKDKKISDGQKKALLSEFDKVFGLKLNKKEKKAEIPAEIKKLAKEREHVRKEKNWLEADRLREIIKKKGFEIKDTKKGPLLNS